MKQQLFESLYTVFDIIVNGFRAIVNISLELQAAVANFLIAILEGIFEFMLSLIDKERVHHTQQVIDQEEINNELQILISVAKVKENVLEVGEWKIEHSEKMNRLCTKLYNECDWSMSKIHGYMRGVVESIPGLSYNSGGQDDDDDDDESDDGLVAAES